MINLAKCHLLMGHWTDAMKAAEIVLGKERKNVQAMLVKAEALYNSCFFEHALVLFHRGKVRETMIMISCMLQQTMENSVLPTIVKMKDKVFKHILAIT